LSRFTSIEPIRSALAEGMKTAIIDGLMALATLAMIFVYSAQLAFVVLIALVLYATVRPAALATAVCRTSAVCAPMRLLSCAVIAL
jgi:ATP-binding cassette subfamily B protein RaxB